MRWVIWSVYWMWALAGLALGAIIAPSLVRATGFTNTRYQDTINIGIAIVMGFLVQVFGTFAGALLWLVQPKSKWLKPLDWASDFLTQWLPVIIVAYLIHVYLTQVGATQRHITISFVDALLIKVVLIPLIKGIVTGVALKFFVRWLRGDKVKAKGA